ncbi:Gfo/Idh/MocA family protein [Synoicihabitans lomoniglobus]|uniref:Gfo/Idh/MocA family oxidoreductase n=1 Tax=Synoicihabitans lomoniglobus TaxID=2909285 RepID=A0AAE9ZSB6_9BACT|nr:Gfo/Idh/MocA family oxidoreductase [Opitutaceae bacterium LMO-M01]WED63331.1 Gfo/Idh/MocA family oxidoreductase [Opitutaceae bacterium LMO-M01]
MSDTLKVGLIGCGKISGAYFEGCQNYPIIELTACADLNVDLARKTATDHGLAFGGSTEDLIARDDVDLIVNLTIPAAHTAINHAALAAGKHVYCEKPFALTASETAALVSQAATANLRLGSAPDTFLGAGLQTARKLIDDGVIGTPVAATAFMLCPGHETWHPNPDFYYKFGGGPMFDMGPYYLTALVNLLGPVARVTGSARKTFAERTITSEPRAGEKVTVDIPTHFSTTLEFSGGPIGTMVMSFDTPKTNLPNIVIHGTAGTLRVCDPNRFDDPCFFSPAGSDKFDPVPMTHAEGRGRGSGVADIGHALRSGRPHRTDGRLAHHVVELMEAATRSSDEGRHITIESTCDRPAPVPANIASSVFED